MHCTLVRILLDPLVFLSLSLDVHPPVPTLAPGKNPLHSFLGFSTDNHVISMSIRDPADEREMPANGKLHVCAYSLRGVRKVCYHITSLCSPNTKR